MFIINCHSYDITEQSTVYSYEDHENRYSRYEPHFKKVSGCRWYILKYWSKLLVQMTDYTFKIRL